MNKCGKHFYISSMIYGFHGFLGEQEEAKCVHSSEA